MPNNDSALIRSGEQKSRRASFLDFGGKNSILQFSSSYQRAQSFQGSSLLEIHSDLDSVLNLPPNNARYVSPSSSLSQLQLEEGNESIEPFTRVGREYSSRVPKINVDEHTPLIYAISDETIDSLTSAEQNDIEIVTGKSTSAQTAFNSINTLMGIGMMSLPFGLTLMGWIPGTALMALCALSTSKTAKILGRIMKQHPELKCFADIVSLYGSPSSLFLVSAMFCLDLTGASLGLILLFSDFFSALLPHIGKQVLKFIIVGIVFLLSFLPLSILSFSSLIGVFCTFGTIGLIIICGLSIGSSPGSLFSPAVTNLWPKNINNFMMALGIFMSPWGGHPVFPEFYLDMKHPEKFGRSVNASFSITFIFDYAIASVGFLMYGVACQDSILKNIMNNNKYPSWTAPLFCVLLGLLPLSKLPLVTRPMISLFESVLSISATNNSAHSFLAKRILARIVFFASLLSLSLLFTSFGRVISFLGSAICFTICLTLPLLFYKHFFAHEISAARNVLLTIAIVLSMAGAVLGTYGSMIMKT